MIYFLSNHKDTAFLESLTNEKITLISHPYIDPNWTSNELLENCKGVIDQAVRAERLVANGDYSLLSTIIIRRFKLGKKTGFICMEKLNKPSSERDEAGNIVHKNILKPINIRWI